MIFSKRAYRKIISVALLSGYILVSVVSLLHYHPVDLNRPSSVSNSTHDTLTGFGSVEDQKLICTIHQNFSLLHKTSMVNDANHSPDLQYFDRIIFINKDSYHSPFNFNNISLRAPPISS
jgi:hypothetical protein